MDLRGRMASGYGARATAAVRARHRRAIAAAAPAHARSGSPTARAGTWCRSRTMPADCRELRAAPQASAQARRSQSTLPMRRCGRLPRPLEHVRHLQPAGEHHDPRARRQHRVGDVVAREARDAIVLEAHAPAARQYSSSSCAAKLRALELLRHRVGAGRRIRIGGEGIEDVACSPIV